MENQRASAPHINRRKRSLAIFIAKHSTEKRARFYALLKSSVRNDIIEKVRAIDTYARTEKADWVASLDASVKRLYLAKLKRDDSAEYQKIFPMVVAREAVAAGVMP